MAARCGSSRNRHHRDPQPACGFG